MRSDRNPYFLLKNSKSQEVQTLLASAPDMTASQIKELKVKPDVKKAMLFVKEFGVSSPATPEKLKNSSANAAPKNKHKSMTTADIIAERMIANSKPVLSPEHEIWQYDGAPQFVKCVSSGWLNLDYSNLYIRDGNRIFLHHVWCFATPDIIRTSTKIAVGNQADLNRLIQQHLNQRFFNPQSKIALK
jgi:hypothetical protein